MDVAAVHSESAAGVSAVETIVHHVAATAVATVAHHLSLYCKPYVVVKRAILLLERLAGPCLNAAASGHRGILSAELVAATWSCTASMLLGVQL